MFPMNFIKESIQNLPANMLLNYFWNMGSMLGFIIFIQILTGVILALFYSCGDFSFMVINFMMRENNIFLFRWMHLNGASFFFMFLYFHMLRSLMCYSFRMKILWISGVFIYILSIATAFMGYVLPWGQMSFWAATVITGLFSVLPYGNELVMFILSGFFVNKVTLTTFYTFHFLLPMVILGLVLFHLQFLHESGSSSKLFLLSSFNKIHFDSFFSIKDILNILFIFILFIFILKWPYLSADSENFIEANQMMSPLEIKPEWYFLWLYAILRSIPNKIGGVIMMVFSLIMMIVISFKSKKKPLFSFFLSSFLVYVIFILSWIGGNPVEAPFLIIGQVFTFLYFFIMMLISFFF